MKKNKRLIPLMIMAIFLMPGCNSSKNPDSSKQEVSDSVNRDTVVSDSACIAFITDLYNNSKYENDEFLKANCTPKMLRKLQKDYHDEYDGPEDALAVWEFRSGVQDGTDQHGIISVKPLGDSWFRYDFHDMGVKAANKIRLITKGGRIMIDDLESISSDLDKESDESRASLSCDLTGHLKGYSVKYYQLTHGPGEEERDRINIEKDGQMLASCHVPSGYAVKNGDLGDISAMKNGFSVNIMWGGGRQIHSLLYVFEYRDKAFYLVRAIDDICIPSSDEEEEVDRSIKKTFTPPVPFDKMNLEEYIELE